MQRLIQCAAAFVLALASVTVAPTTQPERVLAAGTTVTTCDEASFDAALATVLAADGGEIIFDCAGTITFTTTKVINRSVAIYGNGDVILDGGETTRLFNVSPAGNLTLYYLTLQNGAAPGGQTPYGGAIYNRGALGVIATTFDSNRSDAGTGGAISNDGGGARAIIVGSTFVNNYALSGGGALENFRGQMEIVDSTFTGNASGITQGSVLFAQRQSGAQGYTEFVGSTIARQADGIEIHLLGDPEVRMSTTIFAGSCAFNVALVSDGYNLARSGTSCNFDQPTDIVTTGITDTLGGLADNGGPTPTMLPLDGSNALGAIPPAACGTLNTQHDQRGVVRPQEGNCEIGAVEVTTSPIPVRIFGALNLGPEFEQLPVNLHVVAFVPNGETAHYEFDCANDGTFEISQVDDPSAACVYTNSGDYTVAVRVSDSSTSAEATVNVSIETAPPVIDTVATTPNPATEGQQVQLTVTFSDPSPADSHTCEVDWGDGSPPAAGIVIGTQCDATHTYADNLPAGAPQDYYTISVEICDIAFDCDTGSTTQTIDNAAPVIDPPTVDIEPSDEGQSVVASATFVDPGTNDTHTCSVDYGDGSGPVAGTVNGTACAGPPHVYVDDGPSGIASADYTITVAMTDNDGGVGSNTATHTVNNVPPAIDGVATNGPVPQGHPVTVTVSASDVGVNDILSYYIDCDDDGSYELGPQAGNEATCALDPAQATATIGVRVTDDDLGMATATVEVGQTLTLCLNYSTGGVGVAGASGCAPGTLTMNVPGPATTTVCINSYTGALTWSSRGTCSPGSLPHIVPDDGPLYYCESLWTGKLRYSHNGQCNAYEAPGVIPG